MNQQKQFRKVGRCCSNRAAVWTTPCYNDLLLQLRVTAVVDSNIPSLWSHSERIPVLQLNFLPNRDRERLHLSRYKLPVGSAPLCHIQKCRWLKVTWNPICARNSKSATAAFRAGGADKEWKGKVWKGTGAREQRVPCPARLNSWHQTSAQTSCSCTTIQARANGHHPLLQV